MDAWVTIAVDKKTCQAAKELGKSLRNVSTKKHSIVLVDENLCEALENELSKTFDETVKVTMATETCLDKEGRLKCVQIHKIRRGIFLSPFVKVTKNLDNLFEKLNSEESEKTKDKKIAIMENSPCFAFCNLQENVVQNQIGRIAAKLSEFLIGENTGSAGSALRAELLPEIYCLEKSLNLSNCEYSPSPSIQLETNEPIAIVGMSCRFPKAESPGDFWKLIVSLEEAIGPIPPSRVELVDGWDASVEGGFLSQNVGELDGSFFEMSRTELNTTDPQQRLSLEVSWEALEDARIDPTLLKGTNLGVFAGNWSSDFKDLLTSKKVVSKGGQVFRRYIGTGHGAIPGRLSYFYGGIGPSVTTDSACSSSMAALGLAMTSLRKGTSDVALAVGANLVIAPFDPNSEALMSGDGRCKTFEDNADGYGRAEGIATLVLKRLSDAERDGDRIHALLLGVGHCTKPMEGSIATPDVEGEARSMELALKDAGERAEDVTYVEFHGTGTSSGDLSEFLAAEKVYGGGIGAGLPLPLYVGSVKANIGHPEAASGLAGIIKTTLALKEKRIPPHRRIRQMNSKIDVEGSRRLRIPHEAIPWGVSPGGRRLAGVNSFGVLGTYYHVIMEEYDAERNVVRKKEGKKLSLPWNILTFSAKSEVSLQETMKRYLTFWDSDDIRPSVSNVAFSTSTTRAHLRPFRASFVVGSEWSDVKKYLENAESLVKTCGREPRVCFLLTGQGSQWFGMGRAMYETYPAFTSAFDKCHAILKRRHDVDLIDYLWGNPEGFSDAHVLQNQSGIFVMEFCTSKLLASLGLTPSAVLGHSLGEFSAACIAGILSLEDALFLIVSRAKLLLKFPAKEKSAMLAVMTKGNTMAEIFAEYSTKFSQPPPEISAMNADDQFVLGGPEESILRIKEIVEARGIFSVLLATSHAFHSSLMDPILPQCVELVDKVSHAKPTCRFLSSVFGWTDQREVTDWVQYWSDVTRKSVDFLGACQSDAMKDVDIFVEIGPHPVLSRLVAKNIPNSKTVGTMKRGGDDVRSFSDALSAMYTLGVDISWSTLYAPFDLSPVDLPFYAFNRKFYWFTDEEVADDYNSGSTQLSVHPLLGTHTRTVQNLHIFDAEIRLKKKVHSYLNDHCLGDTWVFPGAGHVEIALSAANFLRKNSGEGIAVVVENLEISAALGKSNVDTGDNVDEDNLHIQTIATPSGDTLNIEVFSAVGSEEWKSHARCSSHVTSSQPPRHEYVKIPEEQLSDDSSTSEMYAKFVTLGYNFGPEFQRFRNFWKATETTTIFQMDLRGLESRYVAHPVLIDAMFFATLFVDNFVSGEDIFKVPVSIDKLTVYDIGAVEESAFIHVFRDTSRVVVLNERQDAVIAEMEGLTNLPTTLRKVKESLGVSHKPLIFKHFWQKTPVSTNHEAGIFKALNLKEIFGAIKSDATFDASILQREDFQIMRDVIGLHYLKVLIQMGLAKSPGQSFTGDELAGELRVLPVHRRFFALILTVLTEDGYLRRAGNSFSLVKPLPGLSALEKEIREKSQGIRGVRRELETAEACVEAFPGVLQGDASILPILFPTEESEVSADKFYQSCDWYAQGNRRLVKTIRRVLESLELADQSELRILEVGGGTGAATVEVIALLESLGISYVYTFTDISPAFFPAIQQKLKPLMTSGKGRLLTAVLNLEVDVISQGFAPFDFHVVLSSLVLHATRDLRTTCLNLRKVCAGVVCILEGDGLRREIDVVFGAVEGFWLFQDDVRTTHPNVNAAKWVECLQSCGFSTNLLASDDAVVLVGEATNLPVPFYEDVARFGAHQNLPMWVVYIPQGSTVLRRNLGGVIEALKTLGRNVDIVESAEEGERAINSAANFEGFLFTAGLAEDAEKVESSALKNFLHLIQIILARCSASSIFPRFVVPVRGVAFLEETDEPISYPPFAATLWGLCKTLRSEYLSIDVKSIDVDNVESLSTSSWLRELFPVDNEPQIALRGEQRLIQRLKDATSSTKLNTRKLAYPPTSAFQLALPSSCALDDLSFVPFTKPATSENEIAVDVKAVGLNFKDILCVLKPSDFFRTQHMFGMDIAGIVTSVGSAVGRSDVNVGDRVAFLNGTVAFRSNMAVDSSLIMKLPPHWSLEDGGTLALPFITAYYCLITVAQMTSQDTVLIHTASGGVGIAAVQLAKMVGAKIVGTAGNKRKRAFLKKLKVDVILNSRSLDFGAEIMKATGGKGVDLVLNSLTGEGFVETSLKCCAPKARFVEMSKLNIWSEEEARAICPGLKYSIVDVGALDEPSIAKVSTSLEELMWAGKIGPLPRNEFPASCVISAAKYLRDGRHIGKVLLKLPTLSAGGSWRDEMFSRDGRYFVTGGFGGIGIEIAKWIVANGGRHLLLSGRRPSSQLVQDTVAMLVEMGAESVEPLIFDIGDVAVTRETITRVVKATPATPLKGIFHCAGVLSDAVLSNQTYGRFQETLRPKWAGTWVLHELSLDLNLPLDFFVLFSSVAGLIGPPGQGPHTVANAAMDALAWLRYSLNLPATTVNWGQWGQVGVAADLKIAGFETFSPESALEKLEETLRARETQVGITTDLRVIPETFAWALETYLSDEDRRKSTALPAQKSRQAEKEADFMATWESAEGAEAKEALIRSHVGSSVRKLLQLDTKEFMDASVSLHQLGLDSLMMIQLKNKMVKDLQPIGLGQSLTMSNADTVTSIADTLWESLQGGRNEEGEAGKNLNK